MDFASSVVPLNKGKKHETIPIGMKITEENFSLIFVTVSNKI